MNKNDGYKVDLEFLELITGAIETFSTLKTDDEKWVYAKSLVADIGGNALNVAVATNAKTINWARSSMDENWLNDYMSEGFYEIDPLIEAIDITNGFTVLKAGSLSRTNTENNKLIELNHGLIGTGYHTIVGMNFSGSLNDGHKLVSISTDLAANEFLHDAMQKRLKLLGAIISAHIGVPRDHDQHEVYRFGSKLISPREVDVLTWLAMGLRNEAIATKLNVAEVTVRMHLSAIRRKLGANTREHALAIALRDGYISL